MPPPADGFLARLLAGPALRAQSDVRLVKLVREGYESAFEEIVRRYGHPLRGYAAAIVGGSADDVTQDALSKAFLALRRDDREIELRPWLYRIVRNTALNDLRDRPPQSAELHERIEGQASVAETVEQREEIEELLHRLRALPEAQRAAIVMRELEGLGHGEIATALGVSGGAARQAIHRARTALRDGLGMAIPLPLVRLMLDGAGSAEIAAGGVGAGVVLKAATATVLVAGTLGAGVALHHGAHSASKPVAGASAGNAKGPGRLATTSGEISQTTHRRADDAREGAPSSRGDGEPVRSDSHGPPGSSDGQTHRGGGDSGSATPGSGASGSDDSSSGDGSSGDGSDSAPESSGSSSGGQDGDEISTLEGDSGSNSGPDSGGEADSLGTESGGSRDSSESDGFSG